MRQQFVWSMNSKGCKFLHIAPLRETGLRSEACLPSCYQRSPPFPLLFYPFLLSSRWIWRSTENRWIYTWNLGTMEKHSLCRKQKMIRYARPLNGSVNCSRLLCNTNRFIKWRTPIQGKTGFKRKHTSLSTPWYAGTQTHPCLQSRSTNPTIFLLTRCRSSLNKVTLCAELAQLPGISSFPFLLKSIPLFISEFSMQHLQTQALWPTLGAVA